MAQKDTALRPGEPSDRDRQAVLLRKGNRTYASIARELRYRDGWKAHKAIERAIEWAFRQAKKEREGGSR